MCQSNDTLEFRRSLDLSASEDNMQRFYDIRAALRDIMYEHLDVTVVWRKQSQEARDAFEKAVSPSHVVLFVYLLLIIVQCKERVPDVMRTKESIRACKIYTGKIFSNYRQTNARKNKVSSASKVRCLLCHIHITFLYLSVSKKKNRSWILRVVKVWRKGPVQLRRRV
jgi:hypothetical protein